MNARRRSSSAGRRRSSAGGSGESNSSDDDDDPRDVRAGGRRNSNVHQLRRSSNDDDEKVVGGGVNAINALTRGMAGAVSGVTKATTGAVSGVTKVTTGAVTGAVSGVTILTTGAVSGVTKVTTGTVGAVGKVATGTVGATFNIIRGVGGKVGGQGSEDDDDDDEGQGGTMRQKLQTFRREIAGSRSTHKSRRQAETAKDADNSGDVNGDDDENENDERDEYDDTADKIRSRQLAQNAKAAIDEEDAIRKSKKANEAFARRRMGQSATAAPGGSSATSSRIVDTNILDKLPIEYRYNPRTATPVLHYLPRLMAAVAARDSREPVQLRSLFKAAAGDVRLHRARVQAALERDMKLIRTYQLENDPRYKERLIRLQERKEMVAELKNDKEQILKDLKDGSAVNRGLTKAETAQLQLVRWQRALELYVYDTNKELHHDDYHDDFVSSSTSSDLLNWQSVFEKLLNGISEDQDISQILMQAAEMCSKLVRESEKSVDDAAQYLADLESAYVVRLEAHEMFARSSLQQVANIEEQFRTAGQAALRIGHQLENAEMKRSQCENASILIRRWWIMESLAEQEAMTGEPIPVEMEMNGGITPNACRLDHLFTKRENSLEASRALKQLRAVVRSRGNAATGGSANSAAGAAMIIDKSGSKRLDLTSDLIARVSDALEERLLNQFSVVYTAGGNYDFSIKPRPGAIDWRELRSLAQALLLFDSGRNLHKRYVEMVLENRFPEFLSKNSSFVFNKKKDDVIESMNDANLNTFDMDATRTKLSQLFHRVSEVCTAEFELIAHVFTTPNDGSSGGVTISTLEINEEMPLVVARALLQRVISDQQEGLQARVNDLLASIDRQGDFDSGAKKLDTFVIIHEKAAGLFSSLRDAADRMILTADDSAGGAVQGSGGTGGEHTSNTRTAVESLKGFLISQELALGNQHRQSYINLELRLLHHDCCACLDQAGCTLVKGTTPRPDKSLAEKGILEEYRAPLLPLHKQSLDKSGFSGILTKPLKPAVLRQPLIHATDALARARVMFGTSLRGGETTARVILSIYNQICCFYGQSFLYPILETLREMLPASAPSALPQLPFNELEDAHDLGVSPGFWVALERIHSAAKSFDRELWAEGASSGGTGAAASAANTHRVWETLDECGDNVSLAFARSERSVFYSELERRGESAILRALDTISAHVQWILVSGGESMLATGASRMLGGLTGGSAGGPYAIPAGSSLETPNSPAVKSLCYCLRVQFVHIQAALTPASLSNFWTALSMRLYDILVARLLQHYYISTVGAVILSRDVEALRSVAMLTGSDHLHWDVLRELLTLYMTPPDAIKSLLTGPSESEASKGLFHKFGKDRCVVFLSRRNDYRYKTTSGLKKSVWVIDMLNDLHVTDLTDGKINIGLFAAGRRN